MAKITNIKELRENLLESFELLKDGSLDFQASKELNSTAGKIIMSSKVEMDYNRHSGYKRTIDFLEVPQPEVERRPAGRPKKEK